MKKTLMLMMAAVLLLGCGYTAKKEQTFRLHGAWLLRHVEYPSGTEEDYHMEGNGTFCLIYDGDSMLYECELTSIPTGLLMMPVAKCPVLLIDKGDRELLYLEDNDPHPLSINDSTITIQRNGILLSLVRADEIYEEWGDEIRHIVASDREDDDAHETNRYVLSAKERQQERTIYWFVISSVFIVIIALFAAHLAITNRRAKRQLQLQLRQIQEVQENRPDAVRQVVATLETSFFASKEYAALQKRVASGQLMKEQDWQQVEQLLKTAYPGFTSQLRSLYPMSELEYQTCLLIKLRIAPKDIAAVLARDMSTISTIRSRLYKKVFGRKGGTKEWDDFILSIGA